MSVVVCEIDVPADLVPPATAGSFVLDSAAAGPDTGRWCMLGGEPRARLWWADGLRLEGLATADVPDASSEDPLVAARSVVEWFGRSARGSSVGLPFIGGAVGYFSYELGRHFEAAPAHPLDLTGLPDYWLGLHGGAVVVDRLAGRAWAVGIDTPFAFAAAEARRIAGEVLGASRPVSGSPRAELGRVPQRDWHARAVRAARAYIGAGDIYQVNLTGLLAATTSSSGAQLFARARQAAAAPFSAWLDCGDHEIVSVSPERFLRLRGREAEMRPIKGTRGRSPTPEADARARRELSESVKDRAELLMIVDLCRNDLGRVCDFGTVRAPCLYGVRTFAAVHHLEAVITGRLAPGLDRWDLLRATFPAGSITGAPKLRAMEVIAELETSRRGVYCGAVGYLDVRGDIDLSVAIRTAVVKNGRVHYGAGGGIVWDSVAEAEYDELLVKARPFAGMLGLGAEPLTALPDDVDGPPVEHRQR